MLTYGKTHRIVSLKGGEKILKIQHFSSPNIIDLIWAIFFRQYKFKLGCCRWRVHYKNESYPLIHSSLLALQGEGGGGNPEGVQIGFEIVVVHQCSGFWLVQQTPPPFHYLKSILSYRREGFGPQFGSSKSWVETTLSTTLWTSAAF